MHLGSFAEEKREMLDRKQMMQHIEWVDAVFSCEGGIRSLSCAKNRSNIKNN